MHKINLQILSFSGAATKIIALVVHALRLQRVGYKPDVIAGVSSGWVVALCYALGLLSTLETFALVLRLDQIFGFVPVKENGKFRKIALIRLMFKGSAGNSKGLDKSMRELVSKQEWEKFKSTSNVRLFTGVTDYTRNMFELIEVNKLSYEDMIQTSVMTSTIPIYCDPIKKGRNYYVDGGVREHNPADFLVDRLIDEGSTISKLVSVYSRPKEKSKIPDWGYDGRSAGRNVSKTINAQMDSISRKNEKSEVRLSILHNFKLFQFFSPYVLKGVYDIFKPRLAELRNETRRLNPIFTYREIVKK